MTQPPDTSLPELQDQVAPQHCHLKSQIEYSHPDPFLW